VAQSSSNINSPQAYFIFIITLNYNTGEMLISC
jgi:hypothetical protein